LHNFVDKPLKNVAIGLLKIGDYAKHTIYPQESKPLMHGCGTVSIGHLLLIFQCVVHFNPQQVRCSIIASVFFLKISGFILVSLQYTRSAVDEIFCW